MSNKIEVFIADDATFIRDLLKKSIRTEFPNCEISEAADGKRALSHLKRAHHVDLILCDWEMPEMSGEEVLKWVRSQEKYHETQFIMVTSRGDKEHIVKAAQAGVNGYLVKPFKSEQLFSKVKKALKACGKLQQAQSSGNAQLSRSGFINDSASVLTSAFGGSFGGSVEADINAPPKQKKKPTKPSSKIPIEKMCKAQIRLGSFSLDALVESITPKNVTLLVKRDDEKTPTLFEQTVIDLAQPDNPDDIARINTYIFKLECAEQRADSRFIHVGLKIVDDDAVKAAFIETFISKQPK